jgi:hypothetical protein
MESLLMLGIAWLVWMFAKSKESTKMGITLIGWIVLLVFAFLPLFGVRF